MQLYRKAGFASLRTEIQHPPSAGKIILGPSISSSISHDPTFLYLPSIPPKGHPKTTKINTSNSISPLSQPVRPVLSYPNPKPTPVLPCKTRCLSIDHKHPKIP